MKRMHTHVGVKNPDDSIRSYSALTDDQLLDAIGAHPILMNRPVVVTSLGTKPCRPSETVAEILPRQPAGEACRPAP
jgi:arsenate reductase-like glutaredoxin family protein